MKTIPVLNLPVLKRSSEASIAVKLILIVIISFTNLRYSVETYFGIVAFYLLFLYLGSLYLFRIHLVIICSAKILL